MCPPLHKVPDKKANDQHQPHGRKTQWVGALKVEPGNRLNEVIEKIDHHIRSGIVYDQGEKEEIEEHVEEIQPEILAEPGLALAPGLNQLQRKEKSRNQEEPVEVIVPVGVSDLVP